MTGIKEIADFKVTKYYKLKGIFQTGRQKEVRQYLLYKSWGKDR